jgi:hypothetical protein
MQIWNGYTFESFEIVTSQHSWMLTGIQENSNGINILLLGIGASYVSLYSDNGISFWSGGELAFQIQDVTDTPVEVQAVAQPTREEIMVAIYEGFQ